MVRWRSLIEPRLSPDSRDRSWHDREKMRSRRNGLCICIAPTRRNDDTVIKTRSRLDPKTEASNDRPKLSMLFGFMRINTDDQNASRCQEMRQPPQRRFQSSSRGVPGRVYQRNVVLAARKAARRCCRYAAVSSAMQFKQTLGRLWSG